MTNTLPEFRYHPDPVATGSVIESTEACERCGQARGFIYDGPTYAEEDVETLCPWCIADGSANEELGAEFTDVEEAPEDVPTTVLDEIVERTPGFHGLQQERWLFHCADGAEFLGMVGYEDVADIPDVIQSLTEEWDAEDLEDMEADGDMTGYLFRCRHCGTKLAYADEA